MAVAATTANAASVVSATCITLGIDAAAATAVAAAAVAISCTVLWFTATTIQLGLVAGALVLSVAIATLDVQREFRVGKMKRVILVLMLPPLTWYFIMLVLPVDDSLVRRHSRSSSGATRKRGGWLEIARMIHARLIGGWASTGVVILLGCFLCKSMGACFAYEGIE